MKRLVIFVLLFAFILQSDARKVCILFEQKTVPTTTILNQESVTIKEEILDVQEDVVITLGDILEVTDELPSVMEQAVTVGAVAEEVVTENTTDVSEAISSASIVTDTTPTNICALEGITLFDDQNVSNF